MKNNLRFLLSLFDSKLKFQMISAVFVGFIGHVFASLSMLFALLPIGDSLAKESHVDLPAALILCVVFGLLRGIIRYFEQYFNHYIAFTLLAQVRSRVYKKLCDLGSAKLEEEQKGNLVSMVTSDIETLEVFYAHTLSPLFIVLFNLIFIFFVAGFLSSFIISTSYLISYLLISLPLPWIIYLWTRKEGKQTRNELGEFSTLYLNSLKSLDEILASNSETESNRRIEEKSRVLYSTMIKSKHKEAWASSLRSFLVSLFFLLIALTGVLLYQSQIIGFFALVVGVGLSLSSLAPAISLAELPQALTQTLASAERLKNLFDEKPLVQENGQEEFPCFTGVEMKKVDFSYAKNEVLKGCDLKLDKKGMYTLMGPSGEGKSTVLKLLMHYYAPEKGNIEYGGKDIESLRIDGLKNNVALMGQTTYLFHESIRDNLKEAKPDATDEEIFIALDKAAIGDFIRSLPQGLDTVYSPDSPNFSTGECQRIGLARIFLRQPSLILLDEPTSNVDAYTEEKMLESIENSSQVRTVLLVTHRKKNEEKAVKKLLLKDGRIKVD